MLGSPFETQGFALGLEALGGQCIFASEVAPRSVALYRKNFPSTPVAGDIWEVDVETEIPPHDILVGGFPCQPFSAVSLLIGLLMARPALSGYPAGTTTLNSVLAFMRFCWD